MKQYGFKVRIDQKELTCFYITEVSTAEKHIQKLLESPAKIFGFDIETGKKKGFEDDKAAGLDPYRSFPSLLQFYDPVTTTCRMFDTKLLPLKMFQPVFDAKRVIAHNALFDQQHMMHGGIKNLKFDDSMIMYTAVKCAEYASIEEEERQLEHEWEAHEGEGSAVDWFTKKERYGALLRTITAKILGIRVDKELQTSDWTSRPLSRQQILYAAQDSWATYECGRLLAAKIRQLGLTKVYELNREALYPVCRMILNGCEIDVEQHLKNCDQWAKEKDELHIKILKIFGGDANVRSTVQISQWLEKNLPLKYQQIWPRSEKTGRMKSDAHTLDEFKHLSFVEPLLEYKWREKVLNTYGHSLIDKICPVTKRLHGGYTLLYTATGRLSSRNPNMQNMPRSPTSEELKKDPNLVDIRKIFRAPRYSRIIGADYNQIELRTAAELSRDPAMLRAYREGHDLHAITASRIRGCPIDRVSKADRQLAKSLNFGLLFGLGAIGLVNYSRWNYGVSIELKQAYSYCAEFFKLYAGYADWQKSVRDDALNTGYTRTKLGKLRKLQPELSYTRSVNTPVQGSAAEVVLRALCNLDRALEGTDAKIINIVHDEILVEVPKESVKEVSLVINTEMQRAMKTIFPQATMNNLVNVQVGKTWAEAH